LAGHQVLALDVVNADCVVFQFLDVPAARLIFEVTIEGTARKVITVRSALMLHNQLEDEVEVKLVNRIRGSAGEHSTFSGIIIWMLRMALSNSC